MHHRTYIKLMDNISFLAVPIGLMGPFVILMVLGVSTPWIAFAFVVAGFIAIVPIYKYLASFKRIEIGCPVCKRKTAVWNERCRDVFLVCSHCGEVDRIKDFTRRDLH